MENIKQTTSAIWKQRILIALSVIGFGVYLVDLYPDGKTEIGSQMAFRLAIVLATVWLAYPQLEQLFKSLSISILLVLLLAAFVIAKNPYILISIVILCVILGIMNYAIRVFNQD